MSIKVAHINQKLDLLCERVKTNTVKQKLVALSAVCEALVKKKAELTIANVVAQLANNKVKLSARTIYNDREGGNPYRELFDIWADYAKASSANVKVSISSDNADILNSDDIKAIQDPVIKYRVNLLYAEVMALRNQNKMLREIKELPSIHSVPELEDKTVLGEQTEKILLDPYEVYLIKTMCEGTIDIGFNEDGGLIAKRPIKLGHRIIPPGFRGALEKIIRSYDCDL